MRYITNPDEIKRIINKIIETNGGIFRLKPTWIARGGSSTPGRRIKLKNIDVSQKLSVNERWFASVTYANNGEEFNKILNAKISTIFKDASDMSLAEHLDQLKLLYKEVPKKIHILVKKGSPSPVLESIAATVSKICALGGVPDEYEEADNPNYPEESYEAFISKMIQMKKLKIEKVLDLK